MLTVKLNMSFLNASAIVSKLRVGGFDDETRCINLFATNTVVLRRSVFPTMHLGALTLGWLMRPKHDVDFAPGRAIGVQGVGIGAAVVVV